MSKLQKPNKTTLALIAATVAFIVVILAVLIYAVVLTSKDHSEEKENKDTVTSKCSVETPYCELKYSEQWKDQMTVEELFENDIRSYVFYAIIGDERYELYTVHFGNSKCGDLFGYLEDIPVYIECHTITESDSLTESELSRYYTMMEGINDIVQSISNTQGYSKP